MGLDNPQQQRPNSALGDPIWDPNVGEWTPQAIQQGYRSRLLKEFWVLQFARLGWVTEPMGKPFGSSGMAVKCPVVMRFL